MHTASILSPWEGRSIHSLDRISDEHSGLHSAAAKHKLSYPLMRHLYFPRSFQGLLESAGMFGWHNEHMEWHIKMEGHLEPPFRAGKQHISCIDDNRNEALEDHNVLTCAQKSIARKIEVKIRDQSDVCPVPDKDRIPRQPCAPHRPDSTHQSHPGYKGVQTSNTLPIPDNHETLNDTTDTANERFTAFEGRRTNCAARENAWIWPAISEQQEDHL